MIAKRHRAPLSLQGFCLLALCASCSPLSRGMQILGGNRFMEEGRYNEAAALYLKAGMDAWDGLGAYNLANAFVRLGQAAAAEPLYAKAAASPNPALAAAAWYNQGAAWFSKGRYADAVKAFRSALILEPGNLEAAAAYETALSALPRDEQAGAAEGGDMREGASDSRSEAMNLSRRSEYSPFGKAQSGSPRLGDH